MLSKENAGTGPPGGKSRWANKPFVLTTPERTHGLADERVAARASGLARAYAVHPERFLSGAPHPPASPVEVWIKAPVTQSREEISGGVATPGGVLDHPGPEAYYRVTVPAFDRNDDVPRDGHDVLAGEGGSGDMVSRSRRR